MNKLLYHNVTLDAETSPFDMAILEVANSGPVKIVSPYIGISYIERIISLSSNWLLISDVEAWLSSLSFRARPRAWVFICENIDRIHHLPGIHAKSVIGLNVAMFGSANLTRTGILNRTEMGMFIDEPGTVQELSTWFDLLWDQTSSPTLHETSEFIQWLDKDLGYKNFTAKEKKSITSVTKRIKTKLSELPKLPPLKVKGEDNYLDLNELAEVLTKQEKRHFDSLEQALAVMLDELAGKGFTLKVAVRYIKSEFPNMLVREIYFGLLRFTANHVRSVFNENTTNRLILIGDYFVQCEMEILQKSVIDFDKFLEYLINFLDFNEPKYLLDDCEIEQSTNFVFSDQLKLVSDLTDTGLLVINDMPGSVIQYSLEKKFEWDGRFRHFNRAHSCWKSKIVSDHVNSNIVKMKFEVLPITNFRDDTNNKIYFDDIDENIDKEECETLLKEEDHKRNRDIDRMLCRLLLSLFTGKSLVYYEVKDLSATIGFLSYDDEKNLNKIIKEQNLKTMNVLQISSMPGMKRGKLQRKKIGINKNLSNSDLDLFPQTQKLCERYLST